jgi:hypothetical protein
MNRVSECGVSDGSGSDREPFFLGAFFLGFFLAFCLGVFWAATYPNTAHPISTKNTISAAAT